MFGVQVVWREQFSQNHTLNLGQFPEQARRLAAGEALLSNGPRPADEEDEDDQMNLADGDDGLLF